jgi:class 3 adenylate cyclase
VSSLSVPSGEIPQSIAQIVAEVGLDLPGYREKTSPDGMLTVAFTDIEGSTAMMERLGEDRFIELMRVHNRIVRGCVHDHGGEVVKSRGDGFLVAFAHATSALDSAVELQRVLRGHNERDPAQSLLVRVGIHTGNIFQIDDDFLGKAVVMAARITGHARGGQILVSDDCRRYTLRVGRWSYGPVTELRLKGLAGAERVYPLEWAT